MLTMPLIIPPGFGQAVYEISLTNDDEIMVVTMGHNLSAWGGSFQDAAEDLFAAFKANMAPQLGNDYFAEGVTLYVGQDGGPPLVFQSTGARQAGSSSMNTLPQNSAYLIRKRTGAAGRRGRGRIYLPGVPEAAVSNTGVLVASQITAVQAAATGWFSELTAPTFGLASPPVVLHRSEGIGVEPPPTVITSFSVAAQIATQRRRLRP